MWLTMGGALRQGLELDLLDETLAGDPRGEQSTATGPPSALWCSFPVCFMFHINTAQEMKHGCSFHTCAERNKKIGSVTAIKAQKM
jgi:hypothetical protein